VRGLEQLASPPRDRPFNHVRAVLFDLDGTLLDSYQSHLRVYVNVFRDLGHPFDASLYAQYYSPNWYLFYERLGLPKDRWPEADRLWLQYYAQERPVRRDGASSVLTDVARSGRQVGLVTSGDRSRVERDLAQLGWSEVFAVAVCGGDTQNRKPHPEPLLTALGRLGVPSSAAVYVGDTIEDVQMGKAAGTATVALPGGFMTKEVLAAAKPDILLDRLADLLKLL
jgi:HAD superfamily hydrolase (TIGR01509 family)